MNFEVRKSALAGFYLLKRESYKSPRLSFNSLGYLTVRAPKLYTDAQIGNFINAHIGWIRKHQPEILVFENGMAIRDIKIFRRENEKLNIYFKWQGNNLIVYADEETFSLPNAQLLIAKRVNAKLTKLYKDELIGLAENIAGRTTLKPAKVRVQAMTSRWGSCSNKGHVTLNTHLIFLPEELREYVILHELAHLKHHNHSKKYWEFLESICPDAKLKKRKLSKNFRTRALA